MTNPIIISFVQGFNKEGLIVSEPCVGATYGNKTLILVPSSRKEAVVFKTVLIDEVYTSYALLTTLQQIFAPEAIDEAMQSVIDAFGEEICPNCEGGLGNGFLLYTYGCEHTEGCNPY